MYLAPEYFKEKEKLIKLQIGICILLLKWRSKIFPFQINNINYLDRLFGGSPKSEVAIVSWPVALTVSARLPETFSKMESRALIIQPRLGPWIHKFRTTLCSLTVFIRGSSMNNKTNKQANDSWSSSCRPPRDNFSIANWPPFFSRKKNLITLKTYKTSYMINRITILLKLITNLVHLGRRPTNCPKWFQHRWCVWCRVSNDKFL